MSVAWLVVGCAGAAMAQLTLTGVKCGQLTCATHEYCSEDTDRCAPCDDVCNTTHHNYDSGLCVKACQGYLHDLRYVSRGGAFSPDIKSVQMQARSALIISCVALVILAMMLFAKCFRFLRQNRAKFTWKYITHKFQPSKNRVKQYPTDLTHHNPHQESAKPKHELKLEIKNPEPPRRGQPLSARDLDTRTSHTEKSIGATTPKTISTNLSNRHPAEDTTLDYSYDNMGMNVTPPPVQASASHHF